MATLRQVIAALVVLAGCDGGNVTTSNSTTVDVNVTDGASEAQCELLCVGKGAFVEVTEVCGGEVQSVAEVPLALIPAKCQVVEESPSEQPAPVPSATATPLAEPSENGPVFS